MDVLVRRRILVVDPEPAVRWGFRVTLGRQGWVERCICAAGEAEAVDHARRYRPHLCVADARTVLDAPGLVRALRTHAGAAGALRVILAADGRAISTADARQLGADAVVSKRSSIPALNGAILRVATGLPTTPDFGAGTLTERELRVLVLIASGATNADIAAALHVAPDTVKRVTRAIYRKLGAHNRASAVSIGRRLGMVA